MATLIFDFDGTLADSLNASIDIFNSLAPQYKIATLNDKQRQQLRQMDYKTFVKLFARYPIKLPLIIKNIRKQLSQQIDQIQPISGINSVIEQIQQHHQLGIVTSNSQANVKKFLQHYQMDHFEFISAGVSLFGKAKKLTRIIDQYQLDKNQTYYIGDETRDVIAAKQVGIITIAVSWGFNSKKILQKQNPDYLIDQPSELLNLLK